MNRLYIMSLLLILCAIPFFLRIQFAYSINAVLVEFLYLEPCSWCPGQEIYYKVYLHNSRVINNIELIYGNNVSVRRLLIYSEEGMEKAEHYNLTLGDWNSIIINEKIVLKGGDQFIDENYVKEIVDFYLTYDIAILSVIPSSYIIYVGEVLKVDVTVQNKGGQLTSFNLSIFYDLNAIETLFVNNLKPSEEQVFHFYWNTSKIVQSNYTLTAFAYPVNGERNVEDNLYNAGIIEVRNLVTRPLNRDVAVLSVIPSKWDVIIGEQVNIIVTIKNFGEVAESFYLNVYCNSSLVEKRQIANLNSSQEYRESFVLNFNDTVPLYYTIRVQIESVEGEINLTNNERICTLKTSPSYAKSELGLVAGIIGIFSLGFLETFSPCLMVLLSFLLAYTSERTTRFKEGFLHIMVFGAGFLLAALFLVLAAVFLFFYVLTFQYIMIWVVCIFAILFGLNLLGLNVLKFLKTEGRTKNLIQKLTRKYSSTYMGLIILGFFFYFLDPCIAPIFFLVSPLLLHAEFALLLFVFSLGVMSPFVMVGILSGSISKLARSTYKHRYVIRAVSGLILISYTIFYIISQTLA